MAPSPSMRRHASSSSTSSGTSRSAYDPNPTPARKQSAFNLDPQEHLPAPTPKRRLLAKVNGIHGRQRLETPEGGDDESSSDELGRLDELGMSHSVVVNRKRNFEVQSPVRRPLVKKAVTAHTARAEKQVVDVSTESSGENHLSGPRRRRGLSVWRLASPPKIKAVQAGAEVGEADNPSSENDGSEEYNSQGDVYDRPPEEGVSASSGEEEAHRHELFLEQIDLDKDPYIFKNVLGSLCRLCLTLHQSESSYLAHTQGKKHQTNLSNREEGQEEEIPTQMGVRVEQSVEQGGRAGYQEDSFSDLDSEFEGASRIRGLGEISQTVGSLQPVQDKILEAIPEPEDTATESEVQEAPPTQTPQSPSTESSGGNGDNEEEESILASEEHPITICGNRLYSDWTGTWDGKTCKVPGVGALFPQGYQPRVGEPEPWICPVRDCQTIFAEAFALGGHFSASHRACLLNDNRDGTMSVIGKRQTKDPETGRMPALVISRKPLDPTAAPPKAAPHKPTRKRRVSDARGMRTSPKKPSNAAAKRSRLSRTTPRSRSSFLVVDIPSNKSSTSKAAQYHRTEPALWQYLCLYLPHDVPFPTNPLVLELISLARQRELPHRWKLQLSGRPNPSINLLCAVLIYLAGDRTPDEPCKGCRSFKVDGKFPECVVLPETGISTELREHFNGRCSGCFYRGLEECNGEDTEESSTSEDEPAITNTPPSIQSVVGRLPSGSSTSKLRVAAINQRKTRPLATNPKPKSPRTEPTSNRVTKARPSTSRPASQATKPNNRGKSSTIAAKELSLASSTSTSSGAAIPYKMAPWELAPGRISVRTSGSKTENIAFSSTYLLSPSGPLALTSTTTFQVLNVQPGHDVSWPEEDEDKTRVCSVAQGVVGVKLCGREFSLGPNGVWKVPAGEGCEIGSVCYGGAVVHVVCVFAG
ncbi:hypothetical protein QBC44DRAFT_362096 [Cladorrhinum sp. PSN332]|nr:hypothetical protein QBC44DRAFT_362096 [Cladorrhinum sp. PSN332]